MAARGESPGPAAGAASAAPLVQSPVVPSPVIPPGRPHSVRVLEEERQRERQILAEAMSGASCAHAKLLVRIHIETRSVEITVGRCEQCQALVIFDGERTRAMTPEEQRSIAGALLGRGC